MNQADQSILKLVHYGIDSGLLAPCEKMYAANLLLDLMQQDSLDEQAWIPEKEEKIVLEDVLHDLLDLAVSRGIVEDSTSFRDLFEARLMNALVPRPSEIQKEFERQYALSPKQATDWFYHLSQASNYIRTARIAQDEKWMAESPYGTLEISINLSKPEKDPKEIAAALRAPASNYPKCQLCMENEGYAGRLNHPGRSNHRIIRLKLQEDTWGFQYSPYVYYDEHCIVLNSRHVPMTISRDAFERLFDFVDQFPHYFLGSNADLPIVGGSILTHEHFQGGRHDFAMAGAPMEKIFSLDGFEEVKAGIVAWPMSVIRLRSENRQALIDAADLISGVWRSYSDSRAGLLAFDSQPHHTVTPVARKKKDVYELDLVLRSNLTSSEHPLGVFHPHEEWHHIKKENIGLIEVMGLAVLPARLKTEMSELKAALLEGKDPASIPQLASHAKWARQIQEKYGELEEKTIDAVFQKEIGEVFVHVLEDAGVFKRTFQGQQAFERFIRKLQEDAALRFVEKKGRKETP